MAGNDAKQWQGGTPTIHHQRVCAASPAHTPACLCCPLRVRWRACARAARAREGAARPSMVDGGGMSACHTGRVFPLVTRVFEFVLALGPRVWEVDISRRNWTRTTEGGLYGTRGTRVTVSAGSLRTAQCVSHKGTMMRVFVARLCAHPQFHSGGKALASFSCCGRTMRMGNAAQSAHLLYGPPPSNGIACLHRALFKRGGNGGGFYKTSSPWCC
jgi:hypothetical protein